MLAVQWPAPFVDEHWWFEVKWDGIRAVATSGAGGLTLRTRNENDVSSAYPEVAAARLPTDLVLDGEIVAFDETGRPSFHLLQQRMNVLGASAGRVAARKAGVHFIVFDLLHDNTTLIELPLEERRRRLTEIELPAPLVLADVFPTDGVSLFEAIKQKGMEGIVGKRTDSRYRPGIRAPDWRKIAYRKRLRALVGGYSRGEGSRTGTFGSLQLGLWDEGDFRWIGAVGTGFDHHSLKLIAEALSEMRRDNPPFASTAGMERGITWVEPRLVAEIEYLEWTPLGHLRAPVFKGLTVDPPETITWQVEGPGS